MPRSGSTLLSSLLSQNTNIFINDESILCKVMADLADSFKNHKLKYSNSDEIIRDNVLYELPNNYFKGISIPIIDRSRKWILVNNLELLSKYTGKMIVIHRPMLDAMNSLVAIRKHNNIAWNTSEELRLFDHVKKIWDGVQYAKANNNGKFIFISYKELVEDTKNTLSRIYEFCALPAFEHIFDNIVYPHYNNEQDKIIYRCDRLHEVRSTISVRSLDMYLANTTIVKCKELDKLTT